VSGQGQLEQLVAEMCMSLGIDLGDDDEGWLSPADCAQEIKDRLDEVLRLPGMFRRLAQEMLEQVSPSLRGVWHGDWGSMKTVYEECARMTEEALKGDVPDPKAWWRDDEVGGEQ